MKIRIHNHISFYKRMRMRMYTWPTVVPNHIPNHLGDKYRYLKSLSPLTSHYIQHHYAIQHYYSFDRYSPHSLLLLVDANMAKTKKSQFEKINFAIRGELRMACALKAYSHFKQGRGKTIRQQHNSMYAFYHGNPPYFRWLYAFKAHAILNSPRIAKGSFSNWDFFALVMFASTRHKREWG